MWNKTIHPFITTPIALVRRLGFLFGLVILAGMIAGASAAQAALSFDPPIGTNIIENRFHQSVPVWAASGDFNEDGILDVVVVSGAPKLHIMLGNDDGTGNGNGTFTQSDILFNDGINPGRMKVGDVNNDGHLDIVFSDNANGTLGVVLGNGNGGFGALTSYLVFGQMRSVALGDLNGDGWLDLIGGNCCTVAGVLLNNGDGTFGAVTIIPEGGPLPGNPARTDIQVADLNGDGKMDVVIANQSPDISVFLGDGAGGLTRSDFLDNDDSAPNGVVLADFNSDGIIDIAANSLVTGFHVFPGNGDGTFGAFTAFAGQNRSPQWTLIVQAADFDGDGNLDLASSNTFDSRNISVVLGDGAGSFGPFSTHPDPIDISVLNGSADLVAGDFNGDGKPDLMVVGAGSRKAVVFLNTTPFPPSEIPFAALDIKKAKVHLDKKGRPRDEFEVKGRFELGVDSDGIDPLTEDVTVIFDGYEETIPAGSFVLEDDDDEIEYEFKGPKGGITKVKLKGNGRFEVKAKGLDLGGLLTHPATDVDFSLQIGDDLGEAVIPLKVDKKGLKGKFKSKKKKHDDDDDDDEDDD